MSFFLHIRSRIVRSLDGFVIRPMDIFDSLGPPPLRTLSWKIVVRCCCYHIQCRCIISCQVAECSTGHVHPTYVSDLPALVHLLFVALVHHGTSRLDALLALSYLVSSIASIAVLASRLWGAERSTCAGPAMSWRSTVCWSPMVYSGAGDDEVFASR